MSKFFEISGYWKDTKEEFSGFIVKEYDDIDEENDELIFEYGWSENDLEQALNVDAPNSDWILTSYKETTI